MVEFYICAKKLEFGEINSMLRIFNSNIRNSNSFAIKEFAKDPIIFEPGTRWSYSLGHDVLAALVSVVSGKKFRDYMKENIFENKKEKRSV